MAEHDSSKRKFLMTGVYVTPAIITLQAAPSFAKSGSEKPNGRDKPDKPKQKPDKSKLPKLLPKIRNFVGTLKP